MPLNAEARPLTLSIVVPLKDEEAPIPMLVERILKVALEARLNVSEIVVVDDGSTDGTWAAIERLAREHPQVSALRLRRNFGKATALMVGVGVATGDIVVTMDGDLQDDPG